MKLLGIKKGWPVLGLITCLASLAIAFFYFQLYLGLPPCPLCILDRIVIAGLALVFLLIILMPIQPLLMIWRSFGTLLVLTGFGIGGRHIWLERFASKDGNVSCIPQEGAKGVIEFLTDAFIGTSDCSVVYWQLFGLSIADLTFILFVVLGVMVLRCSHQQS